MEAEWRLSSAGTSIMRDIVGRAVALSTRPVARGDSPTAASHAQVPELQPVGPSSVDTAPVGSLEWTDRAPRSDPASGGCPAWNCPVWGHVPGSDRLDSVEPEGLRSSGASVPGHRQGRRTRSPGAPRVRRSPERIARKMSPTHVDRRIGFRAVRRDLRSKIPGPLSSPLVFLVTFPRSFVSRCPTLSGPLPTPSRESRRGARLRDVIARPRGAG